MELGNVLMHFGAQYLTIVTNITFNCGVSSWEKLTHIGNKSKMKTQDTEKNKSYFSAFSGKLQISF